jgi:hypothetical protein
MMPLIVFVAGAIVTLAVTFAVAWRSRKHRQEQKP